MKKILVQGELEQFCGFNINAQSASFSLPPSWVYSLTFSFSPSGNIDSFLACLPLGTGSINYFFILALLFLIPSSIVL